MIADSPYEHHEVVLTSRAGAIGGLMGASMMLMLLVILQPASGISHMEVLRHVGEVMLPASYLSASSVVALVIGLTLHLSTGAAFGILYASCQQNIPVRGLIAVGVFYGFILWIGGRFLIGPFIGGKLRTEVCSWSWLLACLLYGVCLTVVAVWSKKRCRAANGRIMPVD
jgi:hypothetical protein